MRQGAGNQRIHEGNAGLREKPRIGGMQGWLRRADLRPILRTRW